MSEYTGPVCVMEVIVCNMTRRGKGVEGDPIRIITEIYTKDGRLIAEHDPWSLTSEVGKNPKDITP